MNKVKSTKYVCPVCDGVLWTTTTHDKLKCDDCDRTFLAPQTATDALRKRILGHLRAPAGQFGLTCEETEYLTGLSHQSCSARFSELKRDGLIVKVGTRETKSGCSAAVYRLAENK